jgi:hypothetical protein
VRDVSPCRCYNECRPPNEAACSNISEGHRKLMSWSGTAAGYRKLVRTSSEKGKTVPLRIKRLAQRSDLVAMLTLAAMICLLGSGLVYLGERVHAPEQTRMIDTGPPDPPLRIE